MLAWLDQQLEVVAAAIGFPADQLAMVLCLFVNYPLGLFFLRLLGSGVPTSLRHLFSIVPSIAFGVWLFGWDLVHSFVSSLLGYMLLYVYAHRSTACPKLMFFYAMAYVAASHIYSMYYSYMDWHLDFTRPQMIITIKLTTLAYNLSDARFREQEDLSSHEKEKQVKKMPSLLEFMGYIYFFPSFLAGPHIYFADYKKFIEGMLHPMGKNQPSTLLPAARKMGEAFLCIALAAPLVAIMPTSHLCTNDYAAQGFLYKLGYLYLAAVGARFSFYFAWLLSEGSFIACGLGYNGTTKNPRTGKEEIKWDRCNNVDVLGWELGTSPRSCIASWNRQVQQWLYNYVYVRSFYTVEVFDEKTQKKIKITKRAWYSTLLTNLLSAFWHGFYPGYYLGFGSMSFVVEAARILRATLRHRFVIMSPVEAMKKAEGETEAETVAEDSPAGKAKEAKPLKPAPTTSAPKMVERPTWIKPLYDLGSWVLTQTSISLCMSSFLVLELSCSLQVWNALFWWAHIGCAVLLAASNLGFLRQFEERRASKTA